jgi:hypothetical protein
MAHHAGSWTQRTARNEAPPSDYEPPVPRQAFHRPRTSFGVAGHIVYTAGALAPLVIGELVEDPNKRWRLMRLVSVGTALAYETIHVVREEQRRKEQEARLADCRSHCRD